jgi:hypothetical protein
LLAYDIKRNTSVAFYWLGDAAQRHTANQRQQRRTPGGGGTGRECGVEDDTTNSFYCRRGHRARGKDRGFRRPTMLSIGSLSLVRGCQLIVTRPISDSSGGIQGGSGLRYSWQYLIIKKRIPSESKRGIQLSLKGLGSSALGVMVQGLGFRVQGSGFRV